MSTNNKVFQVLVTKGNQAVLGAGQNLESLGIGQIGVFDYKTNLSISTGSLSKEFYFAVGVDSTGTGVLDNINFSAGQMIQKENIRDYTFKPHTASRPMVFEITNYKAECDTDYAVKFEFRNAQIYMRQGTNQFTKTFAVKTSCCNGCETCPSGSCVELTQLLLNAMNLDESKMFSAVAIDGAAGEVITDLTAWAALPANASKCPAIRVTVNGLAVNKFCNVNTRYYNPRQTIVVPSLIDGFSCTGKVSITQQAVAEEGNGYDVKNKEYKAGGWNGRPGPYRASTATGLALDGFNYFADETKTYDQIHLVYDQFSTAGWGEYLNNLMTIIAIPESDTITRDSFVGALDNLLSARGFEPLADDALQAFTTPTLVEPAISDPTKDGIA